MIVRHAPYSLLGCGILLVVAFVTIPVLVDTLGTARLGLLTRIWAVGSYFGP